jgi:hypothetical protein
MEEKQSATGAAQVSERITRINDIFADFCSKSPLPGKPEKNRCYPKILVTKRKETGYIGSCWRTTPSTAT